MTSMKKISICIPAAKDRQLRAQAKARGISLSRLAAQAVTTDKLDLLDERQRLRQQIFELRTEIATMTGGYGNVSAESTREGEKA